MRISLFAATLILTLVSLVSCSSQGPVPVTSDQSQVRPATGGDLSRRQAEVMTAQDQHLKKVMVTVEAPVYKLLRDDTKGIPHQRFLIQLANGTTVLIAHDTNMAPHIPLANGDWVRIHGEYIWTGLGGVIHWTHHTDTPAHAGGWIDFNGQRYQ